MPSIDPELFSIQRPQLDRYRFLAQSGLIVETYRSAAGQMQSQGSLHRISINRTTHRRYAYRSGQGAFRAIERPPFTLALQPASVVLEVDGDSADYISIFQSPDLYRSIAGSEFQPEDWDHAVLSTALDPVTLHIALSLALAVEASDGDAGSTDPLLLEHLGQSLACRVVKLLGSRFPSGRAQAGPRSLESQRLRRVIDYIEGHLGEPTLSVEQLAEVAHLSPYHFSRAFKSATGQAPHRFVLERRVERARLHLAESRESLAGIAYCTGFSSQAHFSSIFRRLTGVTPKQYRQSVQA
jgi:AraC family transcriptional regulator